MDIERKYDYPLTYAALTDIADAGISDLGKLQKHHLAEITSVFFTEVMKNHDTDRVDDWMRSEWFDRFVGIVGKIMTGQKLFITHKEIYELSGTIYQHDRLLLNELLDEALEARSIARAENVYNFKKYKNSAVLYI